MEGEGGDGRRPIVDFRFVYNRIRWWAAESEGRRRKGEVQISPVPAGLACMPSNRICSVTVFFFSRYSEHTKSIKRIKILRNYLKILIKR